MNAETLFLRRSLSVYTFIATASMVVLFGLAPGAAFADSPERLAPRAGTAKVSLAGLDLSTSAGARVAYERIKAAAERLCRHPGDLRNIYHQRAYDLCVRESLTDAVGQTRSPVLASLAK
jgi:UrcA family protein